MITWQQFYFLECCCCRKTTETDKDGNKVEVIQSSWTEKALVAQSSAGEKKKRKTVVKMDSLETLKRGAQDHSCIEKKSNKCMKTVQNHDVVSQMRTKGNKRNMGCHSSCSQRTLI